MKVFVYIFIALSLLFSNIALSSTAKSIDGLEIKEELLKVKAVEYGFDIDVNGQSIGKATTQLAVGVPATITFLDENKNETYRIRLTAAFHEKESTIFPMVSHTVQENAGGSWVELLNADVAYRNDIEGSIILFGENSTEVAIKGKTSTIQVDRSVIQKLTNMSCDDKPSLTDEISDVGILASSGDCCGGVCSTGQYYKCCGAITCCACDAGCCSTMR
ncbi:hypothetical protein BGP78_07105 [Pseudoalteromonas sp. MSK9-3]|uniref:hypothetical protein n=1 Tax=Pseudoalteromonas sp. MSK9-3 TaxID=1897633 RepID=UPI000E6BF4B3|nr:hypothetical protein [Pseudoalteromonas sp. MSK9-3]RJE77868.1 hypothetical protein BGP78_07105 [Pseudoalteromonas sp. MSK9-3]